MNYTKANCSSCKTELMIRIAKGDNSPDKVMCKACSQGNKKKAARRYIITGKYKRK